MRRDVYLKSAQRFAQIAMRRMKLMEQYTAEPAVNTSREEHEARVDFAGFLPEFPSGDTPGPEFPTPASLPKFTSYRASLNSQMAQFFTSLFQWIAG